MTDAYATPQDAPAPNDAPAAMTVEAMEKLLSGGGQVEDVADDSGDDMGEHADEQEQQLSDETAPEDAAPEEEKPKRNRAQGRISELANQKKEAETRAEAAERRVQEFEIRMEHQQKQMEKLIAAMTKGEQQPVPTDTDDDILDEVLAKKHGGEISELREALDEIKYDQRITSEFNLGREAKPDFDTAHGFLIAKKAHELMVLAESMEKPITQEDAVNTVAKELSKNIKDMAKMSPKRGAVANTIYKMALASGYSSQAAAAKAAGGVNMKAVERARKEAGAPDIQKESVQPNPGNWQQSLREMAKADGLDDKYVNKFI